MNDAELLSTGILFLATLRFRVMDPRVRGEIRASKYQLMEAAKRCKEKNSALARRFHHSGDFEQMFSLLHAAGLIAWVGPTFHNFISRMPQRLADERLRETSLTEQTEMFLLVQEWLSPSEADPDELPVL